MAYHSSQPNPQCSAA